MMSYEFILNRLNLQEIEEFITIEMNETAGKTLFDAFGASNDGWNKSFKDLEIKEGGKEIVNGKFQLYSILKIPERSEMKG